MKSIPAILAALFVFCSCTHEADQTANYRVVPLPSSIETSEAEAPFVLDSSTKIVCTNDSLTHEAEFLKEYVKTLTGQDLKITNEPTVNSIVLRNSLDNSNLEAYQIDINQDSIVVNGATTAGTFYGIQTLRKAIPAKVVPSKVTYPAGQITDCPRFSYRGAHLDVARHPMEADSVKVFIDMLALHNINHMHWHLTDDQGWRIEIKQYSELAKVGSHRDGTMIKRQWGEYDSIPVDGYYTQEQARDIVKYAADRHITIIPEIDLPGHMVAALTAYPELGCTGGPYEVWKKWGISEDLLCAGNDSIYTFLDAVLTEVADIFPSEYIHIGGDECPKARWKECAKCQAKIKELGLKADAHSTAEEKLQSYVMSRAQETLKRHGRKIIGWDEILEGGAPQDAVIMSWRGVKGAHTAAKTGRDAILTPTEYMYFDYCQSLDRDAEPVSIGGFVPVEKVYSFKPIPDDFTEEEAAHIMGVQANLWREYIKTLYHSQYMELPRLAALSEVQWDQEDAKDYADFLVRVQQLINHYEALGYNYARHIYDVKGSVELNPEEGGVFVTLNTLIDQPIYYTLDGTEPTEESTLYTEPIKINESSNVRAVAIAPDGKRSHEYTTGVRIGKSTFKPYTLGNEPASRFVGTPGALTDGVLGGKSYTLPEWVGIEANDLIATIDLGEAQEVSEVSVRCFIDTANWLFDTRRITVEVSTDGKSFKQVAEESYPAAEKQTWSTGDHTLTFSPVQAQYVRVKAENEKSIPEWYTSAAGRSAYIFCDEICVN